MPEEIFYNAINIVEQNNYSRLNILKEKHQSWEGVWNSLSANEKRICDPPREWEKLEKLGIKLILKDDSRYPSLLKEIPYPPWGIYYLGKTKNNSEPTLAIVGTRKATESGRELARNFSRELSQAGLNIVSGLALGIDAEAHKGALDAGGYTIAVLGNGLDYFYPRTNEKLAKKILAQGGAIISEYPLNSPAYPNHFIERNRIISGLALGVLVVEAPERSGTLATARFALEQNREVFIIPGFINHPNFRGSNQLIRAGAELITASREILETLGLISENQKQTIAFETPEEETVIKILENSKKPVSIDKIIKLTKLEPRLVNQTISFLIVKGAVQETREGYTI